MLGTHEMRLDRLGGFGWSKVVRIGICEAG